MYALLAMCLTLVHILFQTCNSAILISKKGKRAAVQPRQQQVKPTHTDFDLCCQVALFHSGLWSKRRQVKTATGQNGDTETATEMAIFKTATNPNNTYSFSEVYI